MLERQEREKRCEVPEEEGLQETSRDVEEEEFSLQEEAESEEGGRKRKRSFVEQLSTGFGDLPHTGTTSGYQATRSVRRCTE